MERPRYSFIAHFPGSGKRAFNDDRAIPILLGEGFQHQRCSIRFPETVNATRARRIVGVDPRNPAVDVIGLFESVRRNFAAAFAVVTSIRQQYGIAMVKEKFAVAGHTFAIVGNAVKQDHNSAIRYAWMDVPSPQLGPIHSPNCDLL